MIWKFELCWCKKHGRLLINGIPGVELADKKTAYAIMQFRATVAMASLVGTDKATTDQIEMAIRAIDESELPDEPHQVDERIGKLIDDWNGRRQDVTRSKGDDTPFQDTSKIHPI